MPRAQSNAVEPPTPAEQGNNKWDETGETHMDQPSSTLGWGLWAHCKGETDPGLVPRWTAANASSQSLVGACGICLQQTRCWPSRYTVSLQGRVTSKDGMMYVGSRQGKRIHASKEGLCLVSASQAFDMRSWVSPPCCGTALAKVVVGKKPTQSLMCCKYSCTIDQALASLTDGHRDPVNLCSAAASVEWHLMCSDLNQIKVWPLQGRSGYER